MIYSTVIWGVIDCGLGGKRSKCFIEIKIRDLKGLVIYPGLIRSILTPRRRKGSPLGGDFCSAEPPQYRLSLPQSERKPRT